MYLALEYFSLRYLSLEYFQLFTIHFQALFQFFDQNFEAMAFIQYFELDSVLVVKFEEFRIIASLEIKLKALSVAIK